MGRGTYRGWRRELGRLSPARQPADLAAGAWRPITGAPGSGSLAGWAFCGVRGQAAVKIVLEPVFEAEADGCMLGFAPLANAPLPSSRPGTSCASSDAAPWRAGQLAKAIHILQTRESGRWKGC